MDENLKPVYEAILEGDMGAATEGVQNALDAGSSAASGRRSRIAVNWSRGMGTTPTAMLADSAVASRTAQNTKGIMRKNKFPRASGEMGERAEMEIVLTFLAKVDGSRCGRATWLAEFTAYSCATAPDFHRLRLLPRRNLRGMLDHPGCRAPAPMTIGKVLLSRLYRMKGIVSTHR